MPTTNPLEFYSQDESADYERVARMMRGEIIPTGGGMAAVSFTEDDETPDGHYLAAIDDDGTWIVTFERDAEDGQREWVEIEGQRMTRDFGTPEAEAEAFIVAGRAARTNPLI